MSMATLSANQNEACFKNLVRHCENLMGIYIVSCGKTFFHIVITGTSLVYPLVGAVVGFVFLKIFLITACKLDALGLFRIYR